jgi:hypothetical protein
MQIRQANREDIPLLSPFVQMVVDEVYGHLWQIDSSLDIRAIIASRIAAEDWSKSWVALDDNTLVGTVLTHEDWIDDLWVLQDFRGFHVLRLRMVEANTRALAFYRRSGWNTIRNFPHETFSFIPMLELQKTVQPR